MGWSDRDGLSIARQAAAAGIQIGLTTADGSTSWFRARAMTPSTLAVTVPRPVPSVAVVAQASARGALGPPSIVAADGSVSVADGQLQDALVPPHWEFAGFDGPFAIFANQRAQPPLRILQWPARRADGGHGVLPARGPRRPRGGGDLGLERHLAPSAGACDRAGRPAGRPRPSG